MNASSNFKLLIGCCYLLIAFFLIPANLELKTIFPLDENQYKFFTGEKRPLPVDGIADFMRKITYPESAIKSKTEGMVYLLVFINEKGDVDYVKIVKGIGSGCDEVAANVIKKTKFVAGFEEGVAVKAKFPLVINFQMPK